MAEVMARLCEAAEDGMRDLGMVVNTGDGLPVVRAILTKLREPGKVAIEAGATAFDDAVDRSYDSDGNGTMRPCIGLIKGCQTDIFVSMLDSILATPAVED